jgi:hypothetical protein
MAISNAQVSVTTAATALNTAAGGWLRMRVALPTGGTTVYLGKSDVTSSNGCVLAAGTHIDVTLAPGDVLYAISGSTSTVHVLRVS